MSGLDPLNIKGHWELWGSSIAEWILFIAGIVMLFMHYWFGFLFMVFWIENFFFWLMPSLIFTFYHHQAYKNKMSFDEWLEYRRFKRLNKDMEGDYAKDGGTKS